jgi:hypothetical protein
MSPGDGPGRAPLDWKEWDFAEERLPQGELAACHAHEYGRELVKRCHQISKLLRIVWRGERAPKGNSHRYGAYLARKRLRLLGIPTIFFSQGSQNLNWYSLSKTVRKRACEEVRQRRKFSAIFEVGLSISTERELEPSRCRAMELYKLFFELMPIENREHIEYGFFAIDWNSKNEVLQESFANWINRQRKERKKSGVLRQGSRGGYRDQLRWLGALRVKEHYRFRNLVDYSEQFIKPRLRVPAPYKNVHDLYAAAKDASEIIKGRCHKRSAPR